MILNGEAPPVLAHCIIEDSLADMTPRFKRVPPFGTKRADAGTSAERNGVGCVINMGDRVECPGMILYCERMNMGDVCKAGRWRWEGEVQPVRSETFAWGFKCYCRGAECDAD